MRNDACILVNNYRGPRGRVDKQFQPRSLNDSWNFAMGVANKKQCLRSSQQLPWSSRMGWQLVSTTIFKWLLYLRLKMWTNYRVIAVDNLLEGRTNRMIYFNQTWCFKTQSKLLSMMQAQPHWATNVRWGGRTLSCVNAKYNYLRQLTLNTKIAKQKCDDQIRMRGRRFCHARNNQ